MNKDNAPKIWEWKKLGEVTECLDSKRIPLNSQEPEAQKRKKLKGQK